MYKHLHVLSPGLVACMKVHSYRRLFWREIHGTDACFHCPGALLGSAMLGELLCSCCAMRCWGFALHLSSGLNYLSTEELYSDSERQEWLAETFSMVQMLHDPFITEGTLLQLLCQSPVSQPVCQLLYSEDSLRRVAKSGRYLNLEEAILHKSVHKGTELGGWIPFPWEISSKQVRPLMS